MSDPVYDMDAAESSGATLREMETRQRPRGRRRQRRRHSLLAIAAFLAVVVGGGCATYQQVTVPELPPQQRVRMRLAAEELARNIAFASGSQGHLNGRFVEARGDSAVFVLTSSTGFSQVVLPVDAILQLERREAAQGRSFLLSVGLVGGVAALAYFGFEGSQGSDTGGDEDSVDALVPLVRFTIPVGR
ncbi:MAG: hypothetical protein OXH51_03835 [Gemmatimonadetes bacterium]|nr:hypothetical protein [Gemmatimonadota bacterium]MCY3677879.1 hypothetical protein [Gemmatimonadota bacterium]MYA42854.1 hypothetical protein [Gemmatimonadota bacterium]MYE94492.1 hypothetical protein [Gemmatimonadota bacterium]MYJ09374.1 hypothetical protein [Gemmatimonadota bacterium]